MHDRAALNIVPVGLGLWGVTLTWILHLHPPFKMKKKEEVHIHAMWIDVKLSSPCGKKSNHTFTNLNTGWIIGNTRGSGLQVRFYKANWFHIAFLWGELNTYWSTARSDIKLLQVSHMTVHNKMCMKSKLFLLLFSGF